MGAPISNTSKNLGQKVLLIGPPVYSKMQKKYFKIHESFKIHPRIFRTFSKTAFLQNLFFKEFLL